MGSLPLESFFILTKINKLSVNGRPEKLSKTLFNTLICCALFGTVKIAAGVK